MYRLLLLFIALFTASGCTKNYPPLPTVEKVDIERYSGRWYEIARYEHYFEKGCRNVTADYVIREDEKIGVLNRCTTEEKKLKEAKGVAYATDASNSKLKVSFFRPFYGDYWILMLDEAYSYAVVGDPSREYLWILSRGPVLDGETTDKILAALPALGYDASKLIWTEQQQ